MAVGRLGTSGLAAVLMAGLGAETLGGTQRQPSTQTLTTRAAVDTHRPVLVYDVTGGTLTGPLHLHLAVYSDGFVAIAASGREPAGRAGYDFVGKQTVRDLEASLNQAQAHRIEASGDMCMDAPVSSVTVFEAGRRKTVRSHTYRYSCSSDERIQAVESVVRDFINEHFPGY